MQTGATPVYGCHARARFARNYSFRWMFVFALRRTSIRTAESSNVVAQNRHQTPIEIE